MTSTTLDRPPAPAHPRLAPIGPNWFASVMGTGIVANAAATLPVQLPALRAAASAVWLGAAVLLVVLATLWVRLWTRRPAEARAQYGDPSLAQFYGAPPMALLTVGAGTVLFGPAVVGDTVALAVGATLWCWAPWPGSPAPSRSRT